MKPLPSLVERIRLTRGTVLVFILILLASIPVTAQSWRGIEPMRSTCEDVGRLLGVDACSSGSISRILTHETVTIVFAGGGCNPKSPTQRYDIRRGTVTDILVIPRYPRRLFTSDLKIDRSKFKKKPSGDLLGVFEYTSMDLGMKFTASKKGQILDLRYFPPARYDYLRCSPTSGTVRLHNYGALAKE